MKNVTSPSLKNHGMQHKTHRLIQCSTGLLALCILLSSCVLGIRKTVPVQEHDEIPTLLNSPETSTDVDGDFTHIIQTAGEQYYLNGPQQAQPPDGTFPKGTRVRLIRDAGSYSIVLSESGVTAHVTSTCLKALGTEKK